MKTPPKNLEGFQIPNGYFEDLKTTLVKETLEQQKDIKQEINLDSTVYNLNKNADLDLGFVQPENYKGIDAKSLFTQIKQQQATSKKVTSNSTVISLPKKQEQLEEQAQKKKNYINQFIVIAAVFVMGYIGIQHLYKNNQPINGSSNTLALQNTTISSSMLDALLEDEEIFDLEYHDHDIGLDDI